MFISSLMLDNAHMTDRQTNKILNLFSKCFILVVFIFK